MIEINLLPLREAQRQQAGRQQVMILGAILILALLVSAGMHLWMKQKIRSTQSMLADLNQQVESYQPQIKAMRAFREKKKEIEAKLAVIEGLEASRSGPVRILDELATHTPKKLWISELEAVDGGLRLVGRSLDNEVISQFLTFLNRSEQFQDVHLEETELREFDGLKLNVFRIRARIRNNVDSEAAVKQQAAQYSEFGKRG